MRSVIPDRTDPTLVFCSLNRATRGEFGGSVIDISGEQNHGTPTDVSWLPDGGFYSNNTGYVVIPNAASINLSNNLTVLCTAKVVNSGALSLVSKYDYGTANRSWQIQSNNGDLNVYVSSDGTLDADKHKRYVISNVFDVSWHRVGFSFASGVLRLFVDGNEPTPTKTVDAAITTIHTSSENLLIGGVYNGASVDNKINGSIKDVEIYSSAKTL